MQQALWTLCAGLVFAGGAFAQGQQQSAQGGASTESRASASAGKGGATANTSGSGSTSVTTDQAAASLAGGTELNATLSKPVDAGKSKPGDEVTATVAEDIKSDGKVVIAKGSKLIGHVTAAQPKGTSGSTEGSSASKLGVVFDRAVLKNGTQIPLNASIQAVAAAESAASGSLSGMDADMSGAGRAAGSGRAAGGGLLGGAGATVGGTVGAVGNTAAGAGGAVSSTVSGSGSLAGKSAGAVGGLNSRGRLTSGSQGVFGLNGLEIASATAGSAEGSVITSTTRNVRLDSGTRLLLVSGTQVAGSGAQSTPGASPSEGAKAK